jgi:hypothetical protein
MKNHEFDEFHIPFVTMNTRGESYKKYAVINVADILYSVGLVQSFENRLMLRLAPSEFKIHKRKWSGTIFEHIIVQKYIS